MSGEVSITLKGGPGYEDPWVTFKGTVAETGTAVQEFRKLGLWDAVKAASAEFQGKRPPLTQVETDALGVIKQKFPNAEVVGVEQELPESMQPKCPECGARAAEKSGKSVKQNRYYKGVFCTADPSHKPADFKWL